MIDIVGGFSVPEVNYSVGQHAGRRLTRTNRSSSCILTRTQPIGGIPLLRAIQQNSQSRLIHWSAAVTAFWPRWRGREKRDRKSEEKQTWWKKERKNSPKCSEESLYTALYPHHDSNARVFCVSSGHQDPITPNLGDMLVPGCSLWNCSGAHSQGGGNKAEQHLNSTMLDLS